MNHVSRSPELGCKHCYQPDLGRQPGVQAQVQDVLWVVFVRDQMQTPPPLPRLPKSGGRGGAGLELLWLLRPRNILCILPTPPSPTAPDPDHCSKLPR